jgi:hypothetical protein
LAITVPAASSDICSSRSEGITKASRTTADGAAAVSDGSPLVTFAAP